MYKYIKNLTKQVLKEFKEGKSIEAETIDEALELYFEDINASKVTKIKHPELVKMSICCA